jgi:hypothetical protein
MEKIKIAPEINKGESPKSPPYSKKKDTLFQNVLKRNKVL